MIEKKFEASCLPTFIGSLPMDDHSEALKLVVKHIPDIPLWVQLPAFKKEGMLAQFLPGMPGLTIENDKMFINKISENFNDDLIQFYEEYLAITEGGADISDSRFVLTTDTASGFFEFLKYLETLSSPPVAVKGQITGPLTFGTSVVDQNEKAIFYDESLRDMAVKLIALKARWQVKQLSKFGCPVIVFLDEPGLAGFGSSAFISISRDEITACFDYNPML